MVALNRQSQLYVAGAFIFIVPEVAILATAALRDFQLGSFVAESVIMGYVPGTDLQIDFSTFVVMLSVITVATLQLLLVRRARKHIDAIKLHAVRQRRRLTRPISALSTGQVKYSGRKVVIRPLKSAASR